jgi:hypothetical protein
MNSTLLSMTFPETFPRGEQYFLAYLLDIPHGNAVALLKCPETYNLKSCNEYITALPLRNRDGLFASFLKVERPYLGKCCLRA